MALTSNPTHALVLLGVGLSYFALAKAGLLLAAPAPGGAFWPAAGLALAAVLLWGPRVAPAIFIAAFLASAEAGRILPALAVAAGATLEALAAGWLLERLSNGARIFETPTGVATFALIVALAALIAATFGVTARTLSGETAPAAPGPPGLSWWLADLAGALVVTPVLVLWARDPPTREHLARLLPVLGLTLIAGLVAFGPWLAGRADRGLLFVVALVPLLWTALQRSRRDTAAVSLVLAAVAACAAALPAAALDTALLPPLLFIVSASLPSLALAAEADVRRRTERDLRQAHETLEATVARRTADLERSNAELRKAIEDKAALQAANEQQRLELIDAQRLANLGSWSWDVATGAVTWSPQLFDIYGITPAAFGGTFDDFLTRVHPDDRAAVSEIVAQACRSGRGFSSEERIVRPDGEVRYLASSGEVVKDAAGNVIKLLGICRDITAEKNADTALRESEEQIRRLVNGIHDYAIFMLDPGGRIVSWNAGAERIKGYRREEILGRHVSTFYTPEDRASDLPGRALGTAARDGRYEGEGWRVRKDGTRFWANVVIDAIHDPSGKLVGFGKITRDVTEKREALLALDEARDQLAQAQKMETIGQVTGGVAHDFNNLLAAIISSLRLLEKRLAGEPQKMRLLENALSAAERGASLTQRLLTFARRQDLKPEIVDVQKLVTDMMELLRRSIGPSVTIRTIPASRGTAALVDPTQLELAIFNLALNARDAMPSGGSLTIEIAEDVVAGGHAEKELKPGTYVRITVRDTGTGMDPETLKRAIEPFFTTKGVGKGTGLGLSMVQGLAAQSGGAMRIESELGKGTTVAVWLPASERAAEPAAPKAPAPPQKVKRCHVLVVDDDPLVSMGTVAMLEDLGHSTVEAASGRQALALLDADSNIDIVITDQAMPGMTGIELVRSIRAKHPKLPIILATGWADLPDSSMPELLRLSKPYRQEDLALAISNVLGRHPEQPPELVQGA